MRKLITILVFATALATMKANMVTITAGSTNILTQYTTEASCVATLKELQITSPCSDVRKIINAFDRNPVMVAVIFQESGFNRTATHINTTGSLKGSEDRGTFQINLTVWSYANRFKNHGLYYIEGNLDNSIAIAKSGSITKWSAYNTGIYKSKLSQAYLLLKNI